MTMLQDALLVLAAVSGGATAALAARQISLAPAPARTLAAYGRAAQPPTAASPTLPARLGLLPPSYARLVRLGAFLPGLVLIVLGYPLIPAAGIGGLVFILADEYLKGRPRRVRDEIEGELAPFLSRLAGSLAVTDAVRKALDDAARALPEASPLGRWLAYLLENLGREGSAYYARARAEAEAISPMLALVAFQLGRLAETGGSGFADAFAILAEELGARQEARAVAAAKAGAARQAVLMMLGIMAGIMVMVLGSPGMRQNFARPVAQLTSAVCFAVMAFGYTYLNGMIAEALE